MSNGLLMKSVNSSLGAVGQVIGIVVHFICCKYSLQFNNIASKYVSCLGTH